MKRKLLIILFFIFLMNEIGFCWGEQGHRWILMEAIDLLPQEIKKYYKSLESELLNKVMDPDMRKGADNNNEAANHYINPELYVSFGFSIDTVPWRESEVLKKVSAEKMNEYGVLPFAIKKTYMKLVEALKKSDTQAIIVYAADLAHYVGDAHQPLHLTENFNGQLTGNLNIHFRFENDLVLEYLNKVPAPAKKELQKIKDIDKYCWEHIKKISKFVPAIIQADNAGVAVSKIYDDKYFRVLWNNTKDIFQAVFINGAYALSEYYYTAYLTAFPTPQNKKTKSTKTADKSKISTTKNKTLKK